MVKAMYLFVLLLFLVFNGQIESSPFPHHLGPRPVHKHIFILAGQSNMAGRGGVHNGTWDGYIPCESRLDPSIVRLNSQLQWEKAHEPLHADIDVNKACGVGPGMAFANAIRSQWNVPLVGLVPCAIGGTKIKLWERGEVLYENMVRRAKESVKEGGMINALLWYQGESDTITEEDADAYKSNMEKLIQDVRSDLGMPLLPVIQVALASGEGPYIEKVREAQKSITLPNVMWVDAQGLPLNEDHLHLYTHSQILLGRMLALAYLTHFANPHF
ncbi:probable carbohydrate esterase At4g34215 [Magnolia sinica]|uniref:probable carbohydrate esterase At4g34215 n=1 Tax=Magnolia sinica TaxID=86752 RepID=UPI00265A08DE|nr:probable carbohydrate esterase At4g34215 [Magnolia sinica]